MTVADLRPGHLLSILRRSAGTTLRTNQPARAPVVESLLGRLERVPGSAAGISFLPVDHDLVLAGDGDPRALAASAQLLRELVDGRALGGRRDAPGALASLLSISELLLNDPGTEDDSAGLREAAEAAAMLTRAVLDTPAENETALNAQVSALAPLLRSLAGRRVECVFDLDPRAGAVRVDPTVLRNILSNLVSSARDAMPDGGSVVVRTFAAAGCACLVVEDDGAPRAGAARTRRTGFGLAHVRALVERVGGRMHIECAGGLGTVVFLELPAAPPPMVLVAEDDDATRDLIRALLERSGFDVLCARDGKEALEMLSVAPVSLALLDVRTRLYSGPEVAERIQARRPDLRVLFLSMHATAARPPASFAAALL